MIFAVKNIDTGDTMYIKDISPLAAIKKARATIPGAKTAKIETLSNLYYFKHGKSMYCVSRKDGEQP